MSKLAKPSFDNYFYGEQLRQYVIQFGAIFSDMKVSIGKNDYTSDTNLIHVPIKYGSMDRVVAHIKTDNTGNKPLSLPCISYNVVGLQLNQERMNGKDVVIRNSKLPLGGDILNDVVVVERRKPTPIIIDMEMVLYASNTNQHFQMVEQIMLLFNPTIQFQTSDSALDWTAISQIDLTQLSLQENYPPDNQPRIIQTAINFNVHAWLSVPANLKDNFIKSAKLRIDAVSTAADLRQTLKDDARSTTVDTLFDIEQYNIPT